jgi:hypothetical protein
VTTYFLEKPLPTPEPRCEMNWVRPGPKYLSRQFFQNDPTESYQTAQNGMV